MALGAGNQELARKALANKVTVDGNIQSFQASYDQISAQTAELRSRVETLKGKLDKMERKIEGKEAEAEAFASMSSDTTFAKDEFKELAQDSAVDSEMARLMAEMNK